MAAAAPLVVEGARVELAHDNHHPTSLGSHSMAESLHLERRDMAKAVNVSDALRQRARWGDLRAHRVLVHTVLLPCVLPFAALWIAFPPDDSWTVARVLYSALLASVLLSLQLAGCLVATYEARASLDALLAACYEGVVAIEAIYCIVSAASDSASTGWGLRMDERTVLVQLSFIYVYPTAIGLSYRFWRAAVPLIAVLMLLAVSPRSVVQPLPSPSLNLSALSLVVVLFTVLAFLPQRFLHLLQRQQRVALQTLAIENRAQLVLLKRVIPDVFIEQLLDPTKRVTSEPIPYVTVLFCEVMVAGVDPATGAVRPAKLGLDLQKSTLTVLSAVFNILERVVERNGVFKVETIFSEFVAVAGLPIARSHHANTAYSMVMTAIDMLREVQDELNKGPLAELAAGLQVNLQIGINTGDVVESILGRRLLPRWKLFGDTVNTTSRMKSNGIFGRIHLSRAAKEHLMLDALPIAGRALGLGSAAADLILGASLRRRASGVTRGFGSSGFAGGGSGGGGDAEGGVRELAGPGSFVLSEGRLGNGSGGGGGGHVIGSGDISAAMSKLEHLGLALDAAEVLRQDRLRAEAATAAARALTTGSVAGTAALEELIEPVSNAEVMFGRCVGFFLRQRPPMYIKGKGISCTYLLELCVPDAVAPAMEQLRRRASNSISSRVWSSGMGESSRRTSTRLSLDFGGGSGGLGGGVDGDADANADMVSRELVDEQDVLEELEGWATHSAMAAAAAEAHSGDQPAPRPLPGMAGFRPLFHGDLSHLSPGARRWLSMHDEVWSEALLQNLLLRRFPLSNPNRWRGENSCVPRFSGRAHAATASASVGGGGGVASAGALGEASQGGVSLAIGSSASGPSEATLSSEGLGSTLPSGQSQARRSDASAGPSKDAGDSDSMGVVAPELSPWTLRFVRGQASLEAAFVSEHISRYRFGGSFAALILTSFVCGNSFYLLEGYYGVATAVSLVSALGALGFAVLTVLLLRLTREAGSGPGQQHGEGADSAGGSGSAGGAASIVLGARDKSGGASALRRCFAPRRRHQLYALLVVLLTSLSLASLCLVLIPTVSHGDGDYNLFSGRPGMDTGDLANDSSLFSTVFVSMAFIIMLLAPFYYGLLFRYYAALVLGAILVLVPVLIASGAQEHVAGTAFLIAMLLITLRDVRQAELRLRASFLDQQLVEEQQARTHRMLLVMLPASIADEMMQREGVNLTGAADSGAAAAAAAAANNDGPTFVQVARDAYDAIGRLLVFNVLGIEFVSSSETEAAGASAAVAAGASVAAAATVLAPALTLTSAASAVMMGAHFAANAPKALQNGGASAVPAAPATGAVPEAGSDGLVSSSMTCEVSLLLIDLVGFTSLSADVGPSRIVELLDDMYASFDRIVARRGARKIETIGDAFLVACGAPEPVDPVVSATIIAKCALDMLGAVQSFAHRFGPRLKGHKLQARIGIHSGRVMAGVIGTQMPRFQLFGAAVDDVQAMESTSEPGRVHASPQILQHLTAGLAVESAPLAATLPLISAHHAQSQSQSPLQLQRQRLARLCGCACWSGGGGHGTAADGSTAALGDVGSGGSSAASLSSAGAVSPGGFGVAVASAANGGGFMSLRTMPSSSVVRVAPAELPPPQRQSQLQLASAPPSPPSPSSPPPLPQPPQQRAVPDIKLVRLLEDGSGFVERDRSGGLAQGVAW